VLRQGTDRRADELTVVGRNAHAATELRRRKMSGKLMIAATAGALLLATTALASAQQRAQPLDRYYGGWGYYGAPAYNYVVPPAPLAPGYYDYAPGYYYPGYYNDSWNGGWRYNDWPW
jgi:hypothetical protein